MNLETLRQIIASIREIEPGRRLVIFGSSSVLASFPNEFPESLGVEITIDADVFLDPDDQVVRETLLNIMGEGREYHRENGFYCDFIDARADYGFPLGWKNRLVSFPGFDHVVALHPLDAAVSKLVATAHARVDKRMGRRLHDRGSKDIDTVVALVCLGHLDMQHIVKRSHDVSIAPAYLAELSSVLNEVLSKI